MKLSQLSYHIIGGDFAIERIFDKAGCTKAPGMLKAEVIIFTGGADVSPELYQDKPHPQTRTNPSRDKFETACYLASRDKLKVGICRGGQFLNVMNGGWLWQHVDAHALHGTHDLSYEVFDDTLQQNVIRTVPVTSTHHQMMMVNKKAHPRIWGYASESTWKETGNRLDMGTGPQVRMRMAKNHNSDIEIVYYPSTKSLCFQPHPEYNHRDTRELFFECIDRALEHISAH